MHGYLVISKVNTLDVIGKNATIGTHSILFLVNNIKATTYGSVQEDGGPFRCSPSFQKQDQVTKKYNAFMLHSTCYGSNRA